MKSFLSIIALLFLVFCAGCGVYSFSQSGKPAFESVNIAQFRSNTIEYQLADLLTDAVIDAFILDNSIEVLEASRAEAVMSGTVTSYRRDPYTYDDADVVSEYAVKVNIHVKVVKSNSEDIIWEEDFFARGVYSALDEEEEQGQEKAIILLTADILDRTTKSW